MQDSTVSQWISEVVSEEVSIINLNEILHWKIELVLRAYEV